MRDRVLDLARNGLPDDEIAFDPHRRGSSLPKLRKHGPSDHSGADPARCRNLRV